MIWTPQRLWLLLIGLTACWWLDPTLLPLLAGVGAFEMGCGCGCGPPPSACEICCDGGIAYTVSVDIPDGLFTLGGLGLCTPCTDLDDLEVLMDNFTVLDDCDWSYTDVTNVCGGTSTSRTFSVSVRATGDDFCSESAGECCIRFRYGLTCDGFPTYYDWIAVFTEGSACTTKTLTYSGALDDGTCCTIDAAPGDVTVNLNP